MRLLFVRHGETEWNRAGRINGWAPVGVSDRGREQADRVAAHVAAAYDVDGVSSSDLRRARQTADRVAAALDVPSDAVDTDSRWRERDFGVYQGLTDEEAREADPDLVERYRRGEASPDERPPSGESPREFRDRVREALTATAGRPGETRVVVTHNGPIVVALAHALGRSVEAAYDEVDAPNGSLSVLEWNGEAGDGAVRRVGSTEFE
jgi:probable phosphoglycerate mutase